VADDQVHLRPDERPALLVGDRPGQRAIGRRTPEIDVAVGGEVQVAPEVEWALEAVPERHRVIVARRQ